jgi:Legume lectin domain
MRSGIRCSSFVLAFALLLCFGASSSAQQIRFEDFSDTNFATRYLQINGSGSLATWQEQAVLRLTDGSANEEATTVYFQDKTHVQGAGKQPVAGGFTTWFQFQVHSPLQCCSPGDGLAFIIQNSNGVDTTMGATGAGLSSLGAGGNTAYPNQAGALGYAGINNNLVIEFDVVEDDWDPNANHIAIQTCGPNINTPVHAEGDYTIGNNNHVESCLLYQSQQSIDTMVNHMGDKCNGESCSDGDKHDVVIGYTPPSAPQPGLLQIWLDPTYFPGTHNPNVPPTMSVPYNIVYDPQNNPSGLQLDPANGGSAWVGFAASQPSQEDGGGTAQDIFGWEFTLHSPVQVQQVIQPGGTPTVFSFGGHQTTVTYPVGFVNGNNTVMVVTATPTDRLQFYQTRLLGTEFANEQCIVYAGTGGGAGVPTSLNGNCIVYTYTCQDQMGNPVTCPREDQPTILIDTTFYTTDQVTPTNADYLSNDPNGDNNWVSIFTSYQSARTDGTTSGKGNGFGGGGSSRRSPSKSRFLTGQVGADIVATFRPGQP